MALWMTPERFRLLRDSVWPLVRDVLLFLGGLAGTAHEVVVSSGERPVLLGFLAAMMGLPLFLRADERNGRGGKGGR